MVFFKILDFKYCGKKYTAFRNRYGYQTYLEYVETPEGKRSYRYIEEETYIRLSNMFGRKKASFYEDGLKEKIVKFIPKIKTKTGLIILTASMLISAPLTACASNNYSDMPLWPCRVFDKNEVILTDDYEVYEITKTINLLTTDGLGLYWTEEKDATFDDVRLALSKNNNIDEYLSDYLLNFTNNLEKTHPNINLACLYYNVGNLMTKATGTQGMLEACGSSTASACFLADDCTIYYNPDKLNEENFEYIMYHEIGHQLVNANKKVKKYDPERHYTTGNNSGFMIEDGINTLLIEEVMGITIDDVAYRLPANYAKIFMDATGYTFEDYVNGNHLEFEAKIASYLNDSTYNVDNLPYLMEYQKYNVRQAKDIEIDDSEFYDLYAIVSAVYFKENINSCTSTREIVDLYNSLIASITNEVYTKEGEYCFDFTAIRDTLFKVLEDNNIRKSIWPNSNDLQTDYVIGTYVPKARRINK